MSIQAMKQALEALKIGQDAFSQAFSGYGYYRPDNPHNFFPDPECCTPKEIAYHSAACEAYDKGTYVPDHSDGWITPELHVTKAPWGIGTYTDECKEITDAITALRAAIEAAEKQEPVAIGGEWTPCVKLPVIVHVREQRPNETHVSTREGITPVSPDDLIMRGVAGEEYPIGRELFNETYTLDTTLPQPAIPDGWVSVNERLPDHRNECLVYSRHIEDGCVVKQSHLNPAKTGFYVEYSDDGETPLEEITHWMPLPAAPKEMK